LNARALRIAAFGGALLAFSAPSVAVRGQSAITIVQPAAGGDAWTPDDVAKLNADLDALLAAAPALRGAHAGVLALDTRTGAPLYARGADDMLQAASSTKLIVGSAALDKLGPAFRFRTTALLDDAGTLVLRGGGDPFLDDAAFTTLAGAVAAAGVRALPRGIAVDDSAFDRVPYPDGWTVDDVPYDYSAPVSALNFDENTVHLTVGPGAAPGSPVRIDVMGRGPLLTALATCAPTANVVVTSTARTGAAGTESTLDLERDPGGCIRVVGAIGAGAKPETLDAAVPSAPMFASRALARALRAKGIALGEPPASSDFPYMRRYVPHGAAALRPLWSHDSASLAEFLGPRFWVPSDNLVAELLLKSLGLHGAGAPGSSAKGIASESAWLTALGVDAATVSLFDGSGLSRYDRVTPRALVSVLQHDWAGAYRQVVLDSLPVGGARGTIPGIVGTPAAGRVFAKTGSFMHVRGLAGYLATQRHGAVTFAFVVDDWNGADAALGELRAAVLSRIIGD